MSEYNASVSPPDQEPHRHPRSQVAGKLLQFEQRPEHLSQRTFARVHGVARATLQHWIARKQSINARCEWVDFFESPAGLAFLHRLQIAAHFVMTLLGPMGVRMVALLFELAGLAPFIATSYSAQRRINLALQDKMAEFEGIERPVLIEKMKQLLAHQGRSQREIITLSDETFHPAVCLVAIEACSNFILLEEYHDRRDADTWNSSMDEAISDLPVKIIACCSDEARALKSHVCRHLGATHLCELFHAQYEITKGCSATLARREREAKKNVEKYEERLKTITEEVVAPADEAIKAGRKHFAEHHLAIARKRQEETAQDREEMREAVRGLGDAYHPYDLESGARRDLEQVEGDLEACYQKARAVAERVGLSERARNCIEKSARLKSAIVASVGFYHELIARRLQWLKVGPGLRELITTLLIPCFYLSGAATRARDATERRRISGAASELYAKLKEHRRWQQLPRAAQERYERFARECAELFVRSSSAVEGRNGQLALHHHGLHRLSKAKLKALTITHNYFLKREDGTTAAERFFGVKHSDLFEWLVENMPQPSRPSKKRRQERRAA